MTILNNAFDAVNTINRFYDEHFTKDIAKFGPQYCRLLAKNSGLSKTNILLSLSDNNLDAFMLSESDWIAHGRKIADKTKVINHYEGNTNNIVPYYSFNNTYPVNLLSNDDPYITKLRAVYYGTYNNTGDIFRFFIEQYQLKSEGLSPKELFLQVARKLIDNDSENILPNKNDANTYRIYEAFLAQTLSYRFDRNNDNLSQYDYFSDRVITFDNNFKLNPLSSLNKFIKNSIIEIRKRLHEELNHGNHRNEHREIGTGERITGTAEQSRTISTGAESIQTEQSTGRSNLSENDSSRSSFEQSSNEQRAVSAVSDGNRDRVNANSSDMGDGDNAGRASTAGTESERVSDNARSPDLSDRQSSTDTDDTGRSNVSADLSTEKGTSSDPVEHSGDIQREERQTSVSETQRSTREGRADSGEYGHSESDGKRSDLPRYDSAGDNTGSEPYQTDLFATVGNDLPSGLSEDDRTSENLSGVSNSDTEQSAPKRRGRKRKTDTEGNKQAEATRGDDEIQSAVTSENDRDTAVSDAVDGSVVTESSADTVLVTADEDNTEQLNEEIALVNDLNSDFDADYQNKSEVSNYVLEADPIVDLRKSIHTKYAQNTYFGGQPYYRADSSITDNYKNLQSEYNQENNDFYSFKNPDNRLENNLKAIDLITELNSRSLDGETVNLTDEQKDILAKYSGWGGLKNELEKNREKILNAGVSTNEFTDLTISSLDSFYTPTAVIDVVYKKLAEMGFKGGEILEPCCGVGKFIGRLPKDLADSSKVTAFEIDPISAKIAYYLYPQSNVLKRSFVVTTAKNHYDVVVGNVPFGQFVVHDPKDKQISGNSIHNYFILKSLNEARAGGIVALITSSYTMDSKTSTARELMVKKGEFLGAVRMPSGAFGGTNTDVVTDIIFLKKRERELTDEELFRLDPQSLQMKFINTREMFNLDGKIVPVDEHQEDYNLLNADVKKEKDRTPTSLLNSYYVENQEQIIGDLSLETNRFGAHNLIPYYRLPSHNPISDLTEYDPVREIDQTMIDAVSASTSKIDGKYLDRENVKEFIVENNISNNADINDDADFLKASPYSFYISNNEIYFKSSNSELPVKKTFGTTDTEILKEKTTRALIELRDQFKLVKKACLYDSDEELKAQQDKLSVLYDDFIKRYSKKAVESYSVKDETLNEGKKTNYKVNVAPISFFIKKNNLDDDPLMDSLRQLDKFNEHLELNDKFYSVYEGKNTNLFTTRFIGRREEIKSAKDLKDALIYSISNKAKVDFDYMKSLLSEEYLDSLPSDETLDHPSSIDEKIIFNLKGEIFLDPEKITDVKPNGSFDIATAYVTRDEYLSGNIYNRIDKCIEFNRLYNTDIFENNISELEKVIPPRLDAEDIDVELGARWVEPKYYESFIREYLGKNNVNYRSSLNYNSTLNKYYIEDKNNTYGRALYETLGVAKCSAIELFESLLNFTVPNVTMKDPYTEKTVIDHDSTTVLIERAKEMKRAFKEWIYEDETRKSELVDTYNRRFNAIKIRKFDGSNLRFEGMNENIHLYSHQKDAIARTLLGGNTLLAHVVGAGKTFEMVASAMEKRRLGLAKKNLIVTYKSVTQQFANDFLTLYPNAKILVADDKNFNKKNKNTFLSKIAYNDYDAIIMSHEQFKEKLPMSFEYQENFINEQIAQFEEYLRYNLDSNSNRDVTALIRSLKSRLEKIREKLANNQDVTALTFEELGIDSLYVDEAHEFKNIPRTSLMKTIRNAEGSQLGADLLMKCDYLNKTYNYKAVTLATGTPLSNSVIDFYTMQRLINMNNLKSAGVDNIDTFMSTFGVIQSDVELDVTSSSFSMKERLSAFTNIPEAMDLFGQVADIKTQDMLDLKVPNVHYHILDTESNAFQKMYIETIRKRAEAIHKRAVSPKEDNLLKLSTEGRHLGLDARTLDLTAPDVDYSKVNICARNIFDVYQKNPESAQIVFCDLATPKSDKKNDYDTEFVIYDDLKQKLINLGLQPNQIAYIHDCDTSNKRTILFDKVRRGDIKVLLGSTKKLGVGVSVQDHLKAVHHLDINWRPCDIEQRNGRIIRQGNSYSDVDIYHYVTKGTFDAFMYQTVTRKAKFIDQIMHFDRSVRKIETDPESEKDQKFSYKECMVASLGDSRVKEQIELQDLLSNLEVVKRSFIKQKERIERECTSIPNELEKYKNNLKCMNIDADVAKNFEQNLKIAELNVTERFVNNEITDIEQNATELGEIPFSFEFFNGNTYTDRKEFNKVFGEKIKAITIKDDSVYIGKFCGFDIEISKEPTHRHNGQEATDIYAHVIGKSGKDYQIQIGISPVYALKNIAKNIISIANNISTVEKNIQQAEDRLAYNRTWLKEHQEWDKQDEYNRVKERLTKLNEEMNNMDKSVSSSEITQVEVQSESAELNNTDINSLDDPHGLLTEENLKKTEVQDRMTLSDLGSINGIEVVNVNAESIAESYEKAVDKLYNSVQSSDSNILIDDCLKGIINNNNIDVVDANWDSQTKVLAKYINRKDKNCVFYMTHCTYFSNDNEYSMCGMLANGKEQLGCFDLAEADSNNNIKADSCFAKTWLRDTDYKYNSKTLGDFITLKSDNSEKRTTDINNINGRDSDDPEHTPSL